MNFAAKYGPWALISGASEGTGAEFARQLAAHGMKLILVARRQGPLAELAAEIRGKGVECLTISADLTANDAADKIIAACQTRDVGLFIANAGADTNGATFLDKDIANWQALVMMNVMTTMRLTHHFGQPMRAKGRGGIILVGSGACYGGLTGLATYPAVKGFLLNFGEGLWGELRHHGVEVLNLIMGQTDTPAHRKLMEEKGMLVPQGMASAADVARIGLEQLPHGPVYNWGQSNDLAGYAPNSPDARRARIVMIEEMSAAYAGKK
ncbi:MAG: hypothetical protein RLY97_2295 [Pseudomonadota bacterium]